MIGRLREIEPGVWLIVVMAAGVGFLAWHRFAANDEDPDWCPPMNAPTPPLMASLPLAPGLHGCGPQMGCSPPFRRRAYADDLISAEFSIIGEF